MQNLILISAAAVTFCWALAVLLLRLWLIPKAPRQPKPNVARCEMR
jgi:hypothetical protein